MTIQECPGLVASVVVAMLAASGSLASAQAQCASTPVATLAPADAMVGDMVGISSIGLCGSGDRVVFGSAGHSHVGWMRGAAWVVSNPGTAMAQTVVLMPAVGVDGAGFAASLAMNAAGNVIVAGAPTASNSVAPCAVYVFRLVGTIWVEEWSSTSPPPKDYFGLVTAMDGSGELIAVGAPRRVILPSLYEFGAVDIYRRQANTWALERSLVKTTEYQYGTRVALSGDGDLLAVRSVLGQVNGSVDLYERAGGAWNLVANLQETLSHSGNGGFANAIDIDAAGETVVAGSYGDWRMGYMSGAVFVYRKGPSGWFLEGEMLLPTQAVGYALGWSVAINAAGDRVLAGAVGHVSNGHSIGAVYEYERLIGSWQQVGLYTSPNPDKWAWFGRRVAVGETGRRWAASEPSSDWNITDGGVVHVFESPCTQPAVYCTAQTNSLGCVPHIGFQGAPSASKPTGFEVTLANTRNQRTGLLFYGTTSPASQPWYGGTLCVQAPLRRTSLQQSGGSALPAADCSGAFSVDFNAWYPNDPALFAGAHVFAQYLSRDPSPTSLVNLSDALDFYVEP